MQDRDLRERILREQGIHLATGKNKNKTGRIVWVPAGGRTPLQRLLEEIYHKSIHMLLKEPQSCRDLSTKWEAEIDVSVNPATIARWRKYFGVEVQVLSR